MSEQIRGKGPATQVRKGSAEDHRRARLDGALRANLKRRKAQIRSRDSADDEGTSDDTSRDTPSIFKPTAGNEDT